MPAEQPAALIADGADEIEFNTWITPDDVLRSCLMRTRPKVLRLTQGIYLDVDSLADGSLAAQSSRSSATITNNEDVHFALPGPTRANRRIVVSLLVRRCNVR
jgi:hypothetical protein